MSHGKLFWPGLVLVFALCGLATSALASGEEAVPALAAIDAACERGEISEAQALLHKVQFVKNSSRLPDKFNLRSDVPIRCATGILQEATELLPTLPADIQRELKELLVRPSNQTYIDTQHFRVHYDTSGSAMIYGWPNTAYRDSVMAACEKSWDFYHVEHSWQIPPSDGGLGGNGLIDCYCIDVGPGIYGYTQSDGPGPNYPNDAIAFFAIDHAYDGFPYSDRTLPMKVTVAHEYNHVVQFGYTTQLITRWFAENTSTFQEDEVYDSINDNYQYLWSYTSTPYLRMTTFNGGREYGCFIWPTMISENWEHDLVRQVWQCAATSSIFGCFDTVLGTYGSNFDTALAEWGVWNFYTGIRNDGNHYVEGGSYPYYMSFDRQLSSYPQYNVHPNTNPDRRPQESGQSVMRLIRNTSSPDNKLTITFDGPDCTQQVMIVVKKAGQTVFYEYYMNLDASGNGTMDIPQWDQMEYGHMISAMAYSCGNGTYDYSFDAVTTTSTSVDHFPLYTRTVDLEQNWPNPFGAETRIGYELTQETPVSLAIFDASGRQVRSLIHAPQASGSYSVRWDGRDDAGHRVAPGVYFYRLDSGDDSAERKMIVLE